MDSSALSRYQYLLRTSAPDQIEKAHEQAFAAMSESERREVLQALSGAGEKANDASASSLARAATRYEMVKPGGLQQLFGSSGGGAASSLGRTALASLAAGFIGSAVWDGVTGGDGLGGRPGVLSRLFGNGGRGLGGYDHGPGLGDGFHGGPHADIGRGEFGGFSGGPGGPGGFDGGPGGPGFGGGPGGPGGF